MKQSELIRKFREGIIFFAKTGMYLKAKVKRVYDSTEGELGIEFESGEIIVDLKKIKKVELNNFSWSYELFNIKGEFLCCIGQMK